MIGEGLNESYPHPVEGIIGENQTYHKDGTNGIVRQLLGLKKRKYSKLFTG